jgi:hypothetical protein
VVAALFLVVFSTPPPPPPAGGGGGGGGGGVGGRPPTPPKTRIVELAVGGEGFDFLGFHHQMVRSRGIHGRRGVAFLAAGPVIGRCNVPGTGFVN